MEAQSPHANDTRLEWYVPGWTVIPLFRLAAFYEELATQHSSLKGLRSIIWYQYIDGGDRS